MTKRSGTTAALSGVLTGVQSHGVWAGRRQLFVRFAGVSETATMFTPESLVKHLTRGMERGTFHSISLTGPDPLSGVAFLAAAFKTWTPPIPVMLDGSVYRPEVIADLVGALKLVQVTVDFSGPDASTDRGLETIAAAAQARCDHALVLVPREGTTDAQVLKLVEQGKGVSSGTKIVIHPALGFERKGLERRFAALLEQAMAIHPDVCLTIPVPSPVGIR